MTDGKTRRPAAFRLDDPGVLVEDPLAPEGAPKAPRGRIVVTPEPEDMFAEPSGGPVVVMPAARRRFRFGRWFAAAFGALVSLAVGVWVTDFVTDLFSRADWLGWTGTALAGVAALALLALILREVAGLMRLAKITGLRADADQAAARDDRDGARKAVREVVSLYAARPDTARARAALQTNLGEIIDGRDLLRLAERELMTKLDVQARALVTASAQRVSVVTAVSPRALVDVAFVAFESVRLIRGIAALYGGRPSGLALVRLIRMALGNLAITGGVAMTDGIVQQVIGHGLAARLSARLGEGVINGLLTARIGLAALDVCRPLPWLANSPPGVKEIMSTLVGTGTGRSRSED